MRGGNKNKQTRYRVRHSIAMERGVTLQANPFRPNHSPKRNRWSGAFFLFLFLMLWAGLLLYLPFFRITTVQYRGLQFVHQDVLDVVIKEKFLNQNWKILPANNFFLVSTRHISDFLTSHYAIKNAFTRKVFPHTLIIDVTEKLPAIIYDNGISYQLLDEGGVSIGLATTVTGTVSSDSVSNSTAETQLTSSTTAGLPHIPNPVLFKKSYFGLPIFYDHRDTVNLITNNQPKISPSLIKSLFEWSKALADGVGGSSDGVQYFEQDNTNSGITAVTSKIKIMFDPDQSAEMANQIIKNIVTEEKPTEYIDIRLSGRAYWK